MDSQKRVAVVTGAGSGIGRASALALQRAGWAIVLAGRRAAELDATAGLADPSGGRVVCSPCDVTDAAQVQTLFATVAREFGRIDVLFNNAGRGAPAVPFEDLPVDTWNSVVAVNLTGVFLCAQAAFRMMKAQSPRGGRIINNGSISAVSPRPLSAPYTATKHAITGLTKSLALDGRPFEIAASQIDIGNAATDLTARMTQGVMQANGTIMPEPRMDVEHVASAVVYIASLPLSANVPFMTIMATAMPFFGRG